MTVAFSEAALSSGGLVGNGSKGWEGWGRKNAGARRRPRPNAWNVILGVCFLADAVMLSGLRCRVFLDYPAGHKRNYLCLCEWRQREMWQRDRREGHATTSQAGVIRPQVMEHPEQWKLEETKKSWGGGRLQRVETHTHTDTQTQTHRQTQTHTDTHTETHTHTQAHTHRHTHTDNTHIDTHTDTHTDTDTHRDTHTQAHTQIHRHRHTQRHTHTQAHTHRHTDNTHTQITHIDTHTDTYTHRHTCLPSGCGHRKITEGI